MSDKQASEGPYKITEVSDMSTLSGPAVGEQRRGDRGVPGAGRGGEASALQSPVNQARM